MRNIILLLSTIALLSCSKERFGPSKLKNGQIVEITLDHKPGSDNQQVLLLPTMENAIWPIDGFSERIPGFNYKIQAKFIYNDLRAADGPEATFKFIKVISKTKYTENQNFPLSLIVAPVPGGPFISLFKTDDKYYINYPSVELTYKDDFIKKQLEEIWQEALLVRNNGKQYPKWKQIKATAKHDPNNFNTAYLIEKVEFLN